MNSINDTKLSSDVEDEKEYDTPSHFVESQCEASYRKGWSETSWTMRYVAPSIQIISQVYNEGLMQNLSMGQGAGPSGTTGYAKPNGGEWGDVWAEPTTNDDSW